MISQFSANSKEFRVMAHAISPLESRDLVARACPEGLAKTSETALQIHKNHPNFQVQVWAGYTTWREGLLSAAQNGQVAARSFSNL